MSDGPSTTQGDPLEGSLGHIAAIVAVEQRPPHVLTAFTRSAEARIRPSSGIETHIGFFERVHLRTDNRGDATTLLADLLRDKAIATRRGPGYVLREVKFGTWTIPAIVQDREAHPGSPISWTGDQVAQGSFGYSTLEGDSNTLTWADASSDPGGIEMVWMVADRAGGRPVVACNIVDATWESPDGTVTPLDGFLDPYFQEVHIVADAIPLFSRYVDEIGTASISRYVERLTEEVYECTVTRPDFGRAARRLYVIFRLTGRYSEAAGVREIFDRPATALYQIAVSLRNLHEATEAGVGLELSGMAAQVDQLIMAAIAALDPHSETEVVGILQRLREEESTTVESGSAATIAESRTEAMSAVDDYYRRALTTAPGVREYLASLVGPAPP